MLKKGLVVGVICLLILTSVPMVSGDNTQLVNSEVLIDEKLTPVVSGGLVDNLRIEWIGTELLGDIFLAMLNLPVFYTHCDISNRNEVPVNINQHIKLETRDGRILYEFDNNIPFPLNPYHTGTTFYFLRPEWRAVDYMWGHFDITLNVHILDDHSRVKLVFHGFVFRCGSVIFNPEGEKIY